MANDISYVDDDELVAQFLTWTSDAVNEMRDLVDAVSDDDIRGSDSVKRIYDLTHNLKGMGASFDFDLVTAVGTSLCSYMKNMSEDEAIKPRIIASHVRAFEVILQHKIKGSGGEQGSALKHRLEAIIVEETAH